MREKRFVKIIYLLIVIFCTNSLHSHAQISQKRREKADKLYFNGEYYRAIKKYKKVYKRTKDKKDKAEINFLIAECYRNINNYRKVILYYKRCARRYDDPITYFHLGNIYRYNYKFDDARKYYKEYIEKAPTDTNGQIALNYLDTVLAWEENPTPHIVENFKEINTKRFDFCGAYDARKDFRDIYFTSTGNETKGKKISNITGEKYSDLFLLQFNKKHKWEDPEPLDTLINTEYDEGCPSLSPDAKEMYFTRCEQVAKKKMGCHIYVSRKNGGMWSEGEYLPIFKDSSFSAAHPAISADGNTLYFASDMKGGEGGKDIWYIEKKDGSFAIPKVLKTPINTPANEMFPYIREDGVLFFASDRINGMGGLDIYKATQNEDGSWNVENMKSPINSTGDDFGIVFQGLNKKGLFTSNRKGGRGNDDIYTFEIPPVEFFLKGIVKEEDSTSIITGATIKLFGSDGSAFTDTTDENGEYEFKLKKRTDYVYAIYKPGFFNNKKKASTFGYKISNTFEDTVILESMQKTIEIENIEYDFGKWTLREESKEALNGLVRIMVENPTIVIELASHSDMIGNDEINIEVSQKRAQSVVDYLIEKGINQERMVAKGYGKSKPRTVSKSMAKKHSFFKEGKALNENYLNTLTQEQQDIANQYNRRTEFKVIATDFVSEKQKKQDEEEEKAKKKRRRNLRY